MRSGFALLLLSVVLLLGGLAAAEPVGTSDVQVFLITPQQEVSLGSTTAYTFALFNGHDGTTYLVQASVVSAPSEFGTRLEPEHAFVGPQEDAQTTLTLEAPDAGRSGVREFQVEFTVVNLDTQASSAVTLTVTVQLLGVPPESIPVNKILGIWPNPLPEPLDNRYGAFGATVAIWALVSLGAVYVVGPVSRAVMERARSELVKLILGILQGPVFVLILVYGAITSVAILGLGVAVQLILERIFAFVVIAVGTWIAYRVFKDVLIYYARRAAERSEQDIGTRMLPNLEKIGGLVIVLVGLAFAFQSLGVDLTILLAGVGVVGLILAFAAQDTLSNFFAGLHIMLDRPFQVGDIVEIEPGVICEVRDIGLRSTKLYWGKEHDILIIPNKDMANRKIVNYLRPDLRFKTNVKVGVAYGTDLDKVEKVLFDIVRNHPDILADEPGYEPLFRVAEFGDNAILVLIIFTVRDARLQWGVRSDITRAIDRRFKEEGITIAFPQRDVWVREWPAKEEIERGGPP